MSFSRRTRDLLTEAGWRNGRKINAKPYEELLRKEGFRVFPAISKFLEQYGGLSFTNPAAVPPAAEDWHFWVEEAVAHAFPQNVELYSKIIDSPLSVVGEASRGHLLLMIDERGRVFGGYSDVFLVIGASGEDAIEGLCMGRTFPPVVPEEPES